MQGKISKMIIFGICVLMTTGSFAKNNHNHNQMWMCETNATSSTNAADKSADESMSKQGKSAKDAFYYAYKHCRDCTKITCTMETK